MNNAFEEKFNYAIGRYFNGTDGKLACYMYYNFEVNYGTLKEANAFLDYVSRKNPNENIKFLH